MATYYLDYFRIYKRTLKKQRQEVRLELTREKRDSRMINCLRRQNNKCFYCGVGIGIADHLDHIIPVYYGGGNQRNNLVASCRECNMEKSTGAIEISNPETIQEYLIIRELFKKRMERYIDGEKSKEWVYQGKAAKKFMNWRIDLFRKLRED